MREKENQEKDVNKFHENSESSSNDKGKLQASKWEWAVAFVGLALVVGALSFMLYKGFSGDDSPLDVKIRLEAVEPVSSGYLVKFSALNQGGTTAEGVIIEAELKGGEKTETSRTTIDFLPSHSSRKGGFFFQNDPRRSDLQIRAVGYQEP